MNLSVTYSTVNERTISGGLKIISGIVRVVETRTKTRREERKNRKLPKRAVIVRISCKCEISNASNDTRISSRKSLTRSFICDRVKLSGVFQHWERRCIPILAAWGKSMLRLASIC